MACPICCPPLGRRAALTGAAGMVAAVPPCASDPGLNERAMAGNRFFGAALDDTLLADDRAYMNRVRAECGIVTGETAFKWGELRPKADVWDWKPADALMAFAARRGIQVRGHTLLWHEHNPNWLVDEADAGQCRALLTAHIHAVTAHCRDRVVQWDVVNEVLEPQDGKPFGLRDTLWYRAMGPELLERRVPRLRRGRSRCRCASSTISGWNTPGRSTRRSGRPCWLCWPG